MKTRRLFLTALLPAAPLAAQVKVNANTQIKNMPAPTIGGDKWLSYIPIGITDGTNAVFTIPILSRSIEVYVNGIRQTNINEVVLGNISSFSFTSAANGANGANLTTITFNAGSIPQVGDQIVCMSTP